MLKVFGYMQSLTDIEVDQISDPAVAFTSMWGWEQGYVGRDMEEALDSMETLKAEGAKWVVIQWLGTDQK